MNRTQVTDGVYRLSANVDNILFEGMWPIPHGIALNSYIVKGERAAIIDGVCGWDGVPETLYEQLDAMDVRVDDIDYVVINHMEPDHSGWLESFRRMKSDFQIYCTQKAVDLLRSFYDIELNIHPVKSGDELDLGDGRTLVFQEIPNVHWPETMATYDTKSGTLFPCDAFGSFGGITDSPYDDELDDEQLRFYEREAERYFANIVGAFSTPTQRAISACAPLDIRIVAPGHGLVWRGNPQRIIDDYARYAQYSKGPAKPKITLLWGSMYGMTERAVEPVLEALRDEGLEVAVHRVPETHVSYALASVWESSGVVIAAPTYEYKLFPPMAAVLDEIGKKRAMNRKALYLGSHGWSGGAWKEIQEINERTRMKWEFLEPAEFRGRPTDGDLERLRGRVRELADAVKAWCAVPVP